MDILFFSLKKDDFNQLYGFCFSRYIQKEYRKKGIATNLLNEAEKWWRHHNVTYIISTTHENNIKLINLFTKFGYKVSKPIQNGAYKYIELKKDIFNKTD